ncbi:uncharacterized protein LOC128882609 [Hylaeus volcanicus]|uniref:uncharacterized protein LOC128882609 n=1 Tax=Hylaeus volcanicus TaxID=313075 RepID=UPI0023B82DE1|nr:uncharacterized protein LOC128882609 [Hylaeus volcanicus]
MVDRRHVNVTFKNLGSANPNALQKPQEASIELSNYLYAWSFWLPRTCCKPCTMPSSIDINKFQKKTKKNRAHSSLYTVQKPFNHDFKVKPLKSEKVPLSKTNSLRTEILNPIQKQSRESIKIEDFSKQHAPKNASHDIAHRSEQKKMDSFKGVLSVGTKNQIKKVSPSFSNSTTYFKTVPPRAKYSKWIPSAKSNYFKTRPLATPHHNLPSQKHSTEFVYHYEMPTICSLCYYRDPEAFCFHAINGRNLNK